MFSKWGSRLGAADIRLKKCNSYIDGGRYLFKIGLSPETSSPFMILKHEICISFTNGGPLVSWSYFEPEDLI